jgi:hypothetical protein
MIHPLGESAEDAERWWQAYQLAENDQDGELRERAEGGDEHARRQLASWLADRGYVNGGLNDPAGGLDEAIEIIRPLADAGDDIASMWLARWLADAGQLDELRLDEWLSRRRARAAESESARRFLAELEENPDWAPFLPLQAD